MWSLYGDKCYGICLCFNDDVEKRIKYYNKKCILLSGDVAYRNFKRSDSVNCVLNLNYKISPRRRDIEDCISELLIGISPFIKNSNYMYEHEFRICIHNYVDSITGSGITYDKSDEYLNIAIPVSSLNSIYVGKKAPFEIIKDMLDLYFGNKNYNINIEKSNIPYK